MQNNKQLKLLKPVLTSAHWCHVFLVVCVCVFLVVSRKIDELADWTVLQLWYKMYLRIFPKETSQRAMRTKMKPSFGFFFYSSFLCVCVCVQVRFPPSLTREDSKNKKECCNINGLYGVVSWEQRPLALAKLHSRTIHFHHCRNSMNKSVNLICPWIWIPSSWTMSTKSWET